MPTAPPKLCSKPGCFKPATNRSRCPDHQVKGSATIAPALKKMYDSVRWKRIRLNQLGREPLCAEHAKLGAVVPATVVDHIVPHKGDPALFFDQSNLQSLCKSCHDRKTATHDGGFGNAGGAGRKFRR